MASGDVKASEDETLAVPSAVERAVRDLFAHGAMCEVLEELSRRISAEAITQDLHANASLALALTAAVEGLSIARYVWQEHERRQVGGQ